MSSLRGVVKVHEALVEIAASPDASIVERLRRGAEEFLSVYAPTDIPPPFVDRFQAIRDRLTYVELPRDPEGQLHATTSRALTEDEAEAIIRDLFELVSEMSDYPDPPPRHLRAHEAPELPLAGPRKRR